MVIIIAAYQQTIYSYHIALTLLLLFVNLFYVLLHGIGGKVRRLR